MSKEKGKGLSRRAFLGTTAAATAGFTIVPSRVVSGLGYKAPSDKLNIAGIGVGGMGRTNLRNMATENIVALCDVDWKYSQKTFDDYPKAKKYWDWRKMYDEMSKDIDAIMVATADHTHALVAAHGMTMGMHAYVQKPLTHSVYESRLLTRLAKKHKLATQMGNQGSSGEGVNLTTEWIMNGEIGEVKKVEAFTDRPIWPQGLNVPTEEMKVPDTLNWDLFTGPARMKPYHEIYTPWNWRGWWDYGTGALGDMACHILHPVFVGLQLQYPIKAQGSSTVLLTDCAPNAQMVKLTYPERKPSPNVKFPEVEVFWYDGGLQPMKPEWWPEGKNMNDSGGGVLFHGSKDTLVCGCYGVNPWLLSGRVPNAPKFRRRIENNMAGGHEQDWIRACKESPENRVETASPFSEAGPFNEMVVMGVNAVRLQGLNKELEWDGEAMEFTNISDSESVRMMVSDNFEVVDGDPKFLKVFSDPINAKEFAKDLVNHKYREGWKLPDMPA
ncbi:MAG: Gfo/Idh/MocA family oxidoreductase [Bacteroidales bacterium]